MFRGKLIVVVAVAILFAQLQCAAACARELCGADFAKTQLVPPCHRHQDHSPDRAPRTCRYQAINPPSTSPQPIAFHAPILPVAALTAGSSSTIGLGSRLSYLRVFAFFPPGWVDDPPAVLRI